MRHGEYYEKKIFFGLTCLMYCANLVEQTFFLAGFSSEDIT